MLNVPNAIKTLFKTDGINKNFRVHFPNGENADLTNSDIISESVKFTESVCSKEVFQFGLSERSQIEFECVNVQNIYGMTIECGIEIDTSSLDAATIAAIQSDPGDGTLVLAGASDIGYGYYRIPYGVFTVESCPRSHGAMSHRQVKAYSAKTGTGRIKLPSFLEFKYSTTYRLTQDRQYMTQVIPLIIAAINNSLGALPYTETTVAPTGDLIGSLPGVSWKNSATDGTVSITFYGQSSGTGQPRMNITDCTAADSVYSATATIDWTNVTPILERMAELNAPQELINYVRGMLTVCVGLQSDTYKSFAPFDDPEDTGIFYPYVPKLSGEKINLYANTATYTRVRIRANGADEYYPAGNVITGLVVKRYQVTDTNALALTMRLTPTYSNDYYCSFKDSFSIDSLYNGWLELNGAFLKYARDGSQDKVVLSKSTPISIAASEYSELWWDEYDISPIGAVSLKFMDITEQIVRYVFGAGASVYTMEDNEVLKNLTVDSEQSTSTPEEYATGLIDSYFIPNIQDVGFTPVDFEMVGLPYLEAGDYIEIDDGDGGTVGTYILYQQISGIQTLFTAVESAGGEIIGEG